eukprot:8535717-Ditylum_brightwellii.AAC.1
MDVLHTANNSVLNKEEFRDQCKICRLIGGKHTEARNDLGCLATQAISPHAVCNNPRVQPCRDSKKRKNAKVADKTSKLEEADVHIIQKKDKDKEGSSYSNLMICHLWKHKVDTLIDVKIIDTDAKSYILHPLVTVLAAQEKGGKGKYLNSCLEQN